MYKLIDSETGKTLGNYKAKSIALRDCEAYNRAQLNMNGPEAKEDYRFYVLKPNGGKVAA
jgi:hypothetical protein